MTVASLCDAVGNTTIKAEWGTSAGLRLKRRCNATIVHVNEQKTMPPQQECDCVKGIQIKIRSSCACIWS